MKKTITTLLFLACTWSYADFAPDNARSSAAYLRFEESTGIFSSTGTAVAYTSFDSNLYSLLGESNATDAYGNYTWTKTSENDAFITIYNQINGLTLTYRFQFESEDGGTFSLSDPNLGTQRGTFSWYNIVLPSELPDTIAINQPSIKVKDGKITIELSIEKSERLNDWIKIKGTVKIDENGTITFETEAEEESEFFKVRFGK